MRWSSGLRATVLACAALGSACGGEETSIGAYAPLTSEHDGLTVGGGHTDASRCDAGPLALPRPSRACSTAGASSDLALGVCGDLRADAALTVRSPEQRALLAVGGDTITGAPLRVEGSLISSGSIEARGTQDVAGHLSTAGSWIVSAPVSAGHDVFVSRVIDARSTVTVGGTVHVIDRNAARGVVASAMRVGPTPVAPPLDCGRAPRAAPLAQALLEDGLAWSTVTFGRDGAVREPTRLTLGCGRYVVPGLDVEDTLELRIRGDVVLVIDGSLRVAAPLRIDLDPGATLDLVIGDALEIDHALTIAPGQDPTRTWLAVGGATRVGAPFHLSGTLVMPDGELRVDHAMSLRGPALVGALRLAAPLEISRDTPADALTCSE